MIIMEDELKDALIGFTNVSVTVRNGVTHTSVEVYADSTKFRGPSIRANLHINRRTQAQSVARIDTGDEVTLARICGVVSRFHL